jgi:CRP/FNR family transcriptional regulator, cyclic AMP receptor protein
MSSSYGLNVVENRSECARRASRDSSDLHAAALCELCGHKFATVYPKGALIFLEGHESRGVHLLCAGRVKLSTSSGDARVLITQIAEPGEILGLNAVLSGDTYEVSAETLEPCRLTFVNSEHFLRFLDEHGDAALRAARQMSVNYRAAFEQTRLLGLSPSAAGKLARFLLDSCARDARATSMGARLILTLTHEEIGQRIGASRETVTRLFSEFKNGQVIQVRGAVILFQDRHALETIANY